MGWPPVGRDPGAHPITRLLVRGVDPDVHARVALEGQLSAGASGSIVRATEIKFDNDCS